MAHVLWLAQAAPRAPSLMEHPAVGLSALSSSCLRMDSRCMRSDPGARRAAADVASAALLVQGLTLAWLLASSGSAAGRAGRAIAVIVVTMALLAAVDAPVPGILYATGLVAGGVGTVVGVGIGIMRLALVGMGTVAVLGTICLLTGLALLGVCLTLSLGARHGWHRLWVVPAGLVMVVLVLFPCTLAAYATNVPHGRDASSDTPASRGSAYESLTLPTSDGARLSGWYVPGTNRAAIIVLHGSGAGSTKASVLSQAAVLARHGYGVLLLDARGHGGSSGYAMDFGWFGEADVAAAVDYLMTRADVDRARVGVLGESMGGEEAIGALAADHRLRAAVAEGATNRVAEDRGWLPNGSRASPAGHRPGDLYGGPLAHLCAGTESAARRHRRRRHHDESC